jgi:hypothetical protein
MITARNVPHATSRAKSKNLAAFLASERSRSTATRRDGHRANVGEESQVEHRKHEVELQPISDSTCPQCSAPNGRVSSLCLSWQGSGTALGGMAKATLTMLLFRATSTSGVLVQTSKTAKTNGSAARARRNLGRLLCYQRPASPCLDALLEFLCLQEKAHLGPIW